MKRYLIECITLIAQKDLRRTKLLFKKDSYNETNIHRNIDGHPNIVVIVRTKTDRFIAGYSTDPCEAKILAKAPSLIMSLTNKHSF